jgi:hypothetical protein
MPSLGLIRARPGPRRTLLAVIAALGFALALLGAATGQAAAAPQLGAAWVNEVSSASATFRGEINPEGEATTYRFEYETEAAYAANPPAERFRGAAQAPVGGAATLGSTPGFTPGFYLATQHVSALKSATAYRDRLLATNPSGSAALEANPAGAPLAFTTQGVGAAFSLPDARGWELVSPPDKNGGAIQGPEEIDGGGVIQAAAGGESAITYSSSASFGQAPAGSPPASQYVSRRSGSGWSTQNVTAPTVSGAYGEHPDGVPYQLFSSDLARGLMLNGHRCDTEPCPRSYSLWEGGAFTGLPEAGDPRFEGASPDLRHLLFGTESGLEEWSGGGLTVLSATPGAKLAAQGAGAVSADGSRVYFTEAGNLWLRESGATHQVDEAQGGGGEFQAATPNGEVAFFTKEVSAANTHLFRYLTSTHTATDLTPSGGVVGVLGASESGSSAYYQDASGLKQWHEGATTTVASGPEAAQPSDYPPTTGTARVSPDGESLLFLSTESLSGYDNHDASTGQPDSEVFLWSTAGGGLRCLSCNPTGERPLGPSSIPGAYANGAAPGSTDSYKPRNLSANGRRAFFDSADALAALDTNHASDAYQWEAQGEGSCARPGGCLGLISSGSDSQGASFIDASESGADAYFLTSASLVPADPGSADVYDARIGGGFPEPPKPIPCESDECAPLPVEPEDPTLGTLVPGPPNPPVHFPPKECPKGTHAVKRQGKRVCVAHKHRKRKRGHP